MVISDLEHLEVVAEGTSVVGGSCGRCSQKPRPRGRRVSANAEGEVFAQAVGDDTNTVGIVETNADAGRFSSSYVYGSSEAKSTEYHD